MNVAMETAASADSSSQSAEMESVQRPVVEVFLDEAGYTGPDLINRNQPVFVLASIGYIGCQDPTASISEAAPSPGLFRVYARQAPQGFTVS